MEQHAGHARLVHLCPHCTLDVLAKDVERGRNIAQANAYQSGCVGDDQAEQVFERMVLLLDRVSRFLEWLRDDAA